MPHLPSRTLATRSLLALLTLVPLAATAAAPPSPPARPRLDVAFVLDTTGSMGDEIDVVKERLVAIARKVSAGQPAPDVRFAIVAFRDRGDAYVTKSFPFARAVSEVEKRLRTLDADGGGDTPEDVAAALHATAKLEWDRGQNVARVAFLVGDAGPQAYKDSPGWEKAVAVLKEKDVTVHTIGCSGLEPGAKSVFKLVAEKTRGDFEALTYRRVERLADGKARTILTEGGTTFVAEGELSDADWKRGATALVAEGRAKKSDGDSAFAGPAMAGLGTRGMGYGGGRAGASGFGLGAPSATPPAESVTNNLDDGIARRLVKAAEEKGAAYVK